MSWSPKPTVVLLLAFHLTVQCQAEIVQWCNGGVMWSEPKAVFVGESFEVFCRCNSSNVRLKDMFFKPSQVKTQVDEYTIKDRVEVDIPSQFVKIHCVAGEDLLGELYVNVVPILNVTGFQCRKFPTDKEATCAFKEIGLAALIPKKSYSLSIDGLPSIPCFKGAHYTSWIDCPGLYIPRDSIYAPNHQIELLMIYEGHNQTLEFSMTLREMTVPEWPMTQPQFKQSKTRICIQWTHTDHSSPLSVPQNWRVEIHSGNPNIKPLYKDFLVFPMFGRDICFPQLPFPNQAYSFRFRRRYNVTGAPWSVEFESKEIISMAAIPNRPPMLLPNGFYHDPEKKELYVFWLQLDKLEFNGPNFTYAVLTHAGKSPSSIDSNGAIFSDWDPTLKDIIMVWSRNSLGGSETNSWLEVPPQITSGSRQPLKLRYLDDNYTLTWQAPQKQQDLTGYAIAWCLGSTSRYQICDDHEPISCVLVEKSQHHFQFNQSMLLYNVAVAANYQDKPSDGMRWIGPRFPSVHKDEHKTTTGLSLKQVIGVLIFLVALLSLSFVSLRKLRKMAELEVTLPDFLFKTVDKGISVPGPPVSIAVPGNFPPNGVILTRNGLVEAEAKAPPDQDYYSEPSSGSASSSNEELSQETEPVIQNQPNPYVTLGTGYVMTPL